MLRLQSKGFACLSSLSSSNTPRSLLSLFPRPIRPLVAYAQPMKPFFLSSPILGCLTLVYLSLFTTALSLTLTNAAQQLTAPLTAPLSTQDATETVAIQQVLNAFAVALDQRRFDLFDHIFTPDVVVNLNIRGLPVLRNLNDVAAYMGRLLQGYRTFHVQSTHYIRLSGPSQAYATTYNSATYLADRQAPIVKWGR